jgi:excinuclease ABC subunit A
MQFLSDVYLRCPDCDGKRYRNEILEVTIEGKSIADVLELTVAEAARFFRKHEDVQRRLQPLVDVGLEYLRLGQPVPTLSGGEAQRLKLAGHLVDSRSELRRSCSCSTSRPPACTSTTSPSCCAPSASCSTPATR